MSARGKGVTRKQIADAFRVARGRMVRGNGPYICWSIPKTAAGKKAREIVMDRLNGHAAVGSWLHHEAGVPWARLNIPRALSEYRLRWLDALIEEFKS